MGETDCTVSKPKHNTTALFTRCLESPTTDVFYFFLIDFFSFCCFFAIHAANKSWRHMRIKWSYSQRAWIESKTAKRDSVRVKEIDLIRCSSANLFSSEFQEKMMQKCKIVIISLWGLGQALFVFSKTMPPLVCSFMNLTRCFVLLWRRQETQCATKSWHSHIKYAVYMGVQSVYVLG